MDVFSVTWKPSHLHPTFGHRAMNLQWKKTHETTTPGSRWSYGIVSPRDPRSRFLDLGCTLFDDHLGDRLLQRLPQASAFLLVSGRRWRWGFIRFRFQKMKPIGKLEKKRTELRKNKLSWKIESETTSESKFRKSKFRESEESETWINIGQFRDMVSKQKNFFWPKTSHGSHVRNSFSELISLCRVSKISNLVSITWKIGDIEIIYNLYIYIYGCFRK